LGNNEIAQLWDVEADKEVRQFKGHDLFVTHVAFSRDTRFALTVAKKREGDKDTFRMHLWDVAIGRELRRFPRHHTDIGRICFTPDGKQAVVGYIDGSVCVWDLGITSEKP